MTDKQKRYYAWLSRKYGVEQELLSAWSVPGKDLRRSLAGVFGQDQSGDNPNTIILKALWSRGSKWIFVDFCEADKPCLAKFKKEFEEEHGKWIEAYWESFEQDSRHR